MSRRALLIFTLTGCGAAPTTVDDASVLHDVSVLDDASAPDDAVSARAGFLHAFHACPPTGVDCMDPRNHVAYLARSADGLAWEVLPGLPVMGSVPDVVRRGDTLYLYTPQFLRRYDLRTGTLSAPVPVTLVGDVGDGLGYVDPSPLLDDGGSISLFFLPGLRGGNPASCAPGETTCTRVIRSAIEVPGSDGASFDVQAGDRVALEIPTVGMTVSDPDVFADPRGFVLYVSTGPGVLAFRSDALHGSYTPIGTLVPVPLGGVPAGHHDTRTDSYWTYVHDRDGIMRATSTTLETTLSASDFVRVSIAGLPAGTHAESPGIALDIP